MKRLLPYILSAFFLVVLAVNYFVRDPNIYPLVRLIPYILAIGLGFHAALFAAKTYGLSNPHGKALLTIAAGMAFILSGDLSFAALEFLHQTVPLPSFADGLYAIGFILFLWGFFQETRLYRVNLAAIDPFTKVIGGLFFLVMGAVVFYLEIFAALDVKISFLANLARMSFGLFDFFLLGIVVLVLRMSLGFGKGKLFLPWLAIFLGFLSSITGDLIYSLTFDKYLMAVWPFTMVNIFWVTSYLLACYGFSGIGNAMSDVQQMIMEKQRRRHSGAQV